MLVQLAYRNILRNFRRSLITTLAIAMGLAVLILSNTLRMGQYEEMIHSGVSQLAGHVVIQHPQYQEEREQEQFLTHRDAIHEKVHTAFPDATITIRSYVGGLLNSTDGTSIVAIQGVDPVAESAVSDLPQKVVDGTWLDAKDNKGIVIGKNIAETLQAKVGDKLVFTTSVHGEMNSQLYRVRGIFRTGSEDIDSLVGFVNYTSVDTVLQEEDIAHQIALHLSNTTETDAAKKQVEQLLSPTSNNMQILSWNEALPDVVAMIKVDQSSNEMINAILLLVVAMGVLNTMLMSVLERTREFGVMLAIGMRPIQLSKLILLEGAVLGIFGCVLGSVLGILFSYPIVTNGIDMSKAMGDGFNMGGAVSSSILYGKYDFVWIAGYMVVAMIMAVLSAGYPAWKLMQLHPVEAMRHK